MPPRNSLIRVAFLGQSCLLSEFLNGIHAYGVQLVNIQDFHTANVLVVWIDQDDELLAVTRFTQSYTTTHVLALATVIPSSDLVGRVLQAGVLGYLQVNPRHPTSELLNALRQVSCGEEYIGHQFAVDVFKRQNFPLRGTLTAKERDVAIRVASGRSNGEIAIELSISKETVKKHVSHILRKCGALKRSQLSGRIF